MANIDSKILQDISSKLDNNIVIKNKKDEEYLTKSQKKLDSEINLKDKRLEKLLKEVNKSDGTYRDEIMSLSKEYIKEIKQKKKLSKEESKSIQSLVDSLDENTNIKRKKEVLNNPLNLVKHGYQNYKDYGLKDGIKKTGSEIKNTSGSLKDSIKQKATFGNISKGILHTAGVLTDSPALNILASYIDLNTKKKEKETLQKEQLINDIKKGDVEPSISNVITSFTKDTEIDRQDINNQKASVDEYKRTGDIEKLLEDMYLDHGNTLEKILDENIEAKILLKEFLFITKDSLDDKKNTKSESVGTIVPTSNKNDIPEEDNSGSLLDNFDMFGRDSKGKKGKKGKGGKKGGKKGVFKGLTKFAGGGVKALGSVAKVLGPIGLAVGTGMAIMDTVEGFENASQNFDLKKGQEATTAQGIASGLGSAISGLSFGILDEKELSQGIEKASDFMIKHSAIGMIRDLFTDDDATKAVNDLEAKGVIDTSIIGDSKIRKMDKVKELDANQVDALIRYNDWDQKTLDELISIKKSKSIEATTPKDNIVKETSNTLVPNIPEIKAPQTISTNPVVQNNQSPVVIPVKEGPSKIDKYQMEDSDLLINMQQKGIRL